MSRNVLKTILLKCTCITNLLLLILLLLLLINRIEAPQLNLFQIDSMNVFNQYRAPLSTFD